METLFFHLRKLKPKRIAPIHFIKLLSQRFIKPLTRPRYERFRHRPNFEKMGSDAYGEFSSDRNIFDVDTDHNKDQAANTKEYRMRIRGEQILRITMDE